MLPHAVCVSRKRSVTHARRHLDPVAVTTYDWMHTLLQGGVFNAEVEAMLTVAAPFGVTRRTIQDWLRDDAWQFPSCTKAKAWELHRIFDERRQAATDPDKLKCSCSEALGVYGLLRFLFETTLGNEARLHTQMAAFRAVCDVLETRETVTQGNDDVFSDTCPFTFNDAKTLWMCSATASLQTLRRRLLFQRPCRSRCLDI